MSLVRESRSIIFRTGPGSYQYMSGCPVVMQSYRFSHSSPLNRYSSGSTLEAVVIGVFVFDFVFLLGRGVALPKSNIGPSKAQMGGGIMYVCMGWGDTSDALPGEMQQCQWIVMKGQNQVQKLLTRSGIALSFWTLSHISLVKATVSRQKEVNV